MATGLVAMSFYSKKGNEGKLQINFSNYVGNEKLKLDTLAYKNELGQQFMFTNVKYYISNITLKSKSGKDFIIKNSFLINELDESSKNRLITNIHAGEYCGVEFILGVDSLHNCSGAQSGDLDPMNAMFWAWNTGYIFLKVEGKSPFSKSPGNYFEFHIGGFRLPYNNLKKIYLPFSNPVVFDKNKQVFTLDIKTDLLEIFKTPNTINFVELSSVTESKNGSIIANNYADMFSIHNEN